MLRTIAIITATAVCVAGIANSSPSPPGWEHISAKPMTHKDPRTSTTLYVESDGRHVAAIDADGKLLWVRDLFEASRPCPTENHTPVVVSIKEAPPATLYAEQFQHSDFQPQDQLIEVMFATNFFGELVERTGDFVCIGIN